jgi:membrane-bound metal-dependent hydrolase YbcI (DUF457 family)
MVMSKYTFIQFVAALESDDFDKIDETWLPWAKEFVSYLNTYSLVWFFVILGLGFGFKLSLLFTLITGISHFITDYITSRIGKPFWKKGDYHNGFVVVGFDQVFHYVQLIYTYNLISSL